MRNNVIKIKKGEILDRNIFLRRLVDALYVRNDIDLQRGNFRVKGDTVDIAMAYSDNILRVTWWDDEIDAIEEVDSISYHRLGTFDEYEIILMAEKLDNVLIVCWTSSLKIILLSLMKAMSVFLKYLQCMVAIEHGKETWLNLVFVYLQHLITVR